MLPHPLADGGRGWGTWCGGMLLIAASGGCDGRAVRVPVALGARWADG